MDFIGYILAVFMGLALGLFGAGGSILAVPILVYFLKVPPVIATGYSLLLVGITALIGSINYYTKKQIDLTVATCFAIPSLITVYLTRRWLVPAIPDPFFSIGEFVINKDLFIMLLFSALMLLAAIMMIRDSHALATSRKIKPLLYWFLLGFEGIVIGLFTGLVGAGGGFMIVPTLVLLAGLEIKVAVGSSLLIIAVKSLLGFVGDLQVGIPLDYNLLGLFLMCTLTGMLAGSSLSRPIENESIKKGFGWFILFLGIMIILKEL
jgi:uncharacterized protein